MSTQITTQKVLAFDSFANFPLTGLEGYIYIDNSANIGYLWDVIANQYVNIGGVDTPVSQDPIPLTFANAATNGVLSPTPNYNNGTLGVGATLIGSTNGALTDGTSAGKIDSTYTPVVGDIILVKNQTVSANPTLNKAFQNGLYVINNVGSVSAPYQLTRIVDFDTSTELYPLQINILSGNNNALKYFIQTTVNPIIGTSNLIFSISSAQSIVSQISFVDTVIDTALSNITYANGTVITSIPGNGATLTSTVNGALGTWNGLTANTNSSVANSFTKVLVINQTNPAHNGDYQVINAGSASTPWKLVRINNTASGFNRYTRYFVVSNTGSTKAGKVYFTTPNATPLTNATIGTAAINIVEYGGSSTGPFGIANSSGVYTYYSTMALAMAAATSGQTIEVFADYTENTGVTITLKDGVNINGNGHTYTFVGTNPGQNIFKISNSAVVNSSIVNYTITGSNSAGASCIYLGTNLSGKLILTSTVLKLTGASTMYLISNFATSNIDIVDLVGYSSTNGVLLASSPSARIINAYIYSSGTAYSGNANVYGSEFVSVNSFGIYNNSGTVSNSIGVSSANYGIQSIGGILSECSGYSTSSIGIYVLYSNAYNCFGYSTASYGIYFTNQPCRGYNCLGYSTVNNGIRMYYIGLNNDLELYNSTAISDGSTAFYWEGVASNITCISNYNNAAGHAAEGANGAIINTSRLTVKNASANCLYKASAVTQKYAQCTFKGATISVNANITQGMINLEDIFGNITI